MTQEALKLAQKALSNRNAPAKTIYEALHAIKKALAQPEQEPDGYVQKVIDALYENSDPVSVEAAELLEHMAKPEQEPVAHWSDCAVHSDPAYPKGECDCGGFPPQRTWVGLTDEEIAKELYKFDAAAAWYQFARAIEAKLKEKNT